MGAVIWQLEPGLNFYRRLYRLDWMQPVERNLPNGRCDYYVALSAEAGLLERLAIPQSATD